MDVIFIYLGFICLGTVSIIFIISIFLREFLKFLFLEILKLCKSIYTHYLRNIFVKDLIYKSIHAPKNVNTWYIKIDNVNKFGKSYDITSIKIDKINCNTIKKYTIYSGQTGIKIYFNSGEMPKSLSYNSSYKDQLILPVGEISHYKPRTIYIVTNFGTIKIK